MKSYIHRFSALCLVLALFLCAIPLAGCGRVSFKEPLTSYVFVKESMFETLRVENQLTEEEQARLLDYLEKKTWKAGLLETDSDYELKNEKISLLYNSELGIINDTKRLRSFTLTSEERLAVNKILHVKAPLTDTPSLNASSDYVTIYYYRTFSGEMSSKTVYGTLAKELIAELSSATETGEIEPAPHDDDIFLPPPHNEAPHDMRNNYWILAGDEMYRYTMEYKNPRLCRVERYAGEGKKLTLTDTFKRLLQNAWEHYPKDSYTGTYHMLTKELTMTHAYAGNSTVRFEIQEMNLSGVKGDISTLILTIDSDKEQVIYFSFWYWSGTDVIPGMATSKVYLNGTDPTTVRIDFETDPRFGTQIDLTMGQTQAKIYIRKE